MPFLAAWLHDLDPFAIEFARGVGVRWYGLAYIAGFVSAWLVLRWLARRRIILLSPEQATDAVFAVIVGTLVGGRLGYILFYDPPLLWTFSNAAPWWNALAINRGGMASHGGIVGVALACWWTARRTGAPATHVMDLFSLVAPIGIFFGRLANFVNGELLGRIVAPPGAPAPWWSVKFPQELLEGHAPALTTEQHDRLGAILDSVSPAGEPQEVAVRRLLDAIQRGDRALAEGLAPLLSSRHPSQLYQAIAEGVVVGGVLWWVWRRPRKPGVMTALFLVVYGVGRIITEALWRLPDAHLAVQRPLGLSRGQWLSVAMVLIGLAALSLCARGRRGPVGGWMGARAS